MLDKKEFLDIRQDLESLEDSREELIRKSREILKISKQIIYSLHRNDLEKAEALVLDIKGKVNGIAREDLDSNINKVAMQEYVEEIRELIEDIYGEFLMFDLRNGDLRRKMDSIKWNLKKIDEVILTARK